MRAREFESSAAVDALKKDLKNPLGYDAIDHMMTTIAGKHGITPKKLHDLFVEKTGMIPDDWKPGSTRKVDKTDEVAEGAITEDAVMGKIEQTGKIVRILKKQHSVPFSDEKDWLLIDTDPARGNSGLGLKWIPAHTRFEWVRPYRDTVAEVADPRFMNFMNTSLGDRTDQPSKKIKTGQDWYDNAPTMNIDSGTVSYRSALDFCNKTLQKLNPTQKIKLSTMGEQGVVSWLAKQAKKQRLIPDQFMEEDIDEVQDFLPEVFHDPAITSWALVLTDGEPLPNPPTKGPFKVQINQGLSLSSPAKGYANSDWVVVDTLDNLPDAEEIFKGMVLKNPNYYVGITGADHKFVKFQDPHKEGMAENFADGRNPQDKGDSVRHGIPKGATMAQLEKAAKAPGRKGQLARWQLNMRRGRKK